MLLNESMGVEFQGVVKSVILTLKVLFLSVEEQVCEHCYDVILLEHLILYGGWARRYRSGGDGNAPYEEIPVVIVHAQDKKNSRKKRRGFTSDILLVRSCVI